MVSFIKYEIEKFKMMHLMIFLFFLIAFIMDTPLEIYEGLVKIISHNSILVTDYIAVGGLGAAFVNVGIVLSICMFIIRINKGEVDGLTFAALWIVAGFSMIGKNFINTLPIYLGAYMYSKYSNVSFKNIYITAMFATCISPAVSYIWVETISNAFISIPFGIIVGALIGFIIFPLSKQFSAFHNGGSLYNVGFTAGVIGIIVYAYLAAMGYSSTSNLILDSSHSDLLFLFVVFICSMYVIVSLFNVNIIEYFKKILIRGQQGNDFNKIHGAYIAMLNAGLLGFVCVILTLVYGLDYNGVIFCSIISVLGFGAFGKNILNSISCMVGLILASFVFNIPIDNEPSSIAAVLGLFFVTGLAPVASKYGLIFGVIAGFTHLVVVKQTAVFHGYLNLYNNGFATGLVGGVMTGNGSIIFNKERKNNG